MAGETVVHVRGRTPPESTIEVGASPGTPIYKQSQELVSILIPCCGQLEYTRLCVGSVLQFSRQPVELIFVDLSSLDGTAEFLAGIAMAAPLRVEVIRSSTALGIPAAFQQAFSRVQGQYLILLANDTLVTDSWIEQLVALANLAPSIGVVGPMSNYAPPGQMVESVPYRIGPRRDSNPESEAAVDMLINVDEVLQFAQQWRQQERGQWQEVDRLGDFCLLFKREVLDKIGHLGASFGLRAIDTDRLCFHARQTGYTLACCRDLFVHNFASRR
jgi:GT2 family glycosyltransferase